MAAGTFLLKPLKEEKKWSEISQVEGILNGTSNFILTKMQNKSYEEAKGGPSIVLDPLRRPTYSDVGMRLEAFHPPSILVLSGQ